MQKYKLALILYSSAAGVFYGVTTASAAPFRDWVHDFVVEGATVVEQFVASNRDLDFKSGVSFPSESVIFTSGVVDPMEAFVQENQLDYQTDSTLLAAEISTRDGFGQSLGVIASNADNQSSASSLNQSVSPNEHNDNPGRFVYQGGGAFPGSGSPSTQQPIDVAPHIFGDKDDSDSQKYPDPFTWPVPPVLRIGSDTPIDDVSDPSSPVTASPVTASFVAAQTIPEAATLALLGLGVAGLSFIRRRPSVPI